MVNSYTIAFAAFILTAGALGDRIGAKRIFMAGFAIFTAASVGCALAANAAIPIAARGVQGLGRRSGASLPRRPRRDLGLLIAEVRRRIYSCDEGGRERR